MKILYITCGSGSDPTLGGSLVRTLEIAERVRNRHKIYFLTTTGGKMAMDGWYGLYEIKTPLGGYQMDKWLILRQLYSYLCVFFQSAFIDLPECDLVYLDSDGLWDIIPAIFYKLKYPNTKLISMNHHLSRGLNRLHQWISHIFIRRWADAVFVLDTPAGEHLSKVIRHPRTFAVWNGIDLETIRSIPEQEKIYDACFFGVLRPGKGLHIIADIWRDVCRERPRARLLIIGDIPPYYRKQLEQDLIDNDIEDNVTITGYIPDQKEAFKLVKQCRIFISPSLEEGWGITIMECIALGLQGVVFDLPVFKWLQGDVIKVNNPVSFSEAILDLLEKGKIPSMPISQYDWDNVAKKEMELYENCVCDKLLPS